MNITSSSKRRESPLVPELFLVELAPTSIIEGAVIDRFFLEKEATPMGKMRELCPICKDVNLQLILRQGRIKQAHLFCSKCARCYDAHYADGSNALSLA
jgi:hypothetical protein